MPCAGIKKAAAPRRMYETRDPVVISKHSSPWLKDLIASWSPSCTFAGCCIFLRSSFKPRSSAWSSLPPPPLALPWRHVLFNWNDVGWRTNGVCACDMQFCLGFWWHNSYRYQRFRSPDNALNKSFQWYRWWMAYNLYTKSSDNEIRWVMYMYLADFWN